MKYLVAASAFFISMILPGFCQTRQDQQAACQEDAYRLCSDDVPDEARVQNCLARNKKELSRTCKAMFKAPAHSPRSAQ